MRYSIRIKSILLIGIPVVLTYLAVMAFDILRVWQRVANESELRMAGLVQNYAKQFDAQLKKIARPAAWNKSISAAMPTTISAANGNGGTSLYRPKAPVWTTPDFNEDAGNIMMPKIDAFETCRHLKVEDATVEDYNAHTWRKPCRNVPRACRSLSASASIAASAPSEISAATTRWTIPSSAPTSTWPPDSKPNAEAGRILISAANYELVSDSVRCSRHRAIRVKGIDRKITTYWIEG